LCLGKLARSDFFHWRPLRSVGISAVR
jgi:hypothetical protein